MYQKHELGKIGEEISCIYLQKNGYEIIQRNFRCNKYEIDIVAKDKKELVFIEVKTRSSGKYGLPADSVTREKRKHIYRAAKYYLHINKQENAFVRLDVIEIYLYKTKYYVHHIKQII